MKTLTVKILNPAGEVVAWVRMSSRRQLQAVLPETGGSRASSLSLPTGLADITTLGCLAAAAAQEAGLEYLREWQGQWDLEPSTITDRRDEP